MNLNLTTKKTDAQIEIIIVKKDKLKDDKELLEQLNFKGEEEECVLLPESKKIYVGCEGSSKEDIRIAMAAAVRKLNSTKFTTAKVKCKNKISAYVEGLELGNYTFEKYKSKKEKKEEKNIYLVVEEIDKKLQKEFEDTIAVCQSVNMVRDFINTTPDDFYPAIMASKAIEIAKNNELECQVLDEDYLEQNGMKAMLSVGRASRHKSKLIHVTYKPKNPLKKVVLVGKGLTYDSGGLSLKPSDFMTTMKSDKSGACAVLGIINAAAKLELPFEIHAIIGAVENMIGGDAYKPDDVLTARNGTTIEVKNTDAEGRLVLADCLCYAQDEIEDIDMIIDYATLTGACVVGVGEYTSGVMGNNEELKDEIIKGAQKSGELATKLDFNKYLKKTLKSEIADICNISNTRYGGAITAGLFLEKFIDENYKQSWVHIDIAGPAFVEKAWGYNPFGASGAGVRMTIEFLKNMVK